MAKLVMVLADGTTMEVPLRRERIVIGRRADNDICLPNIAVSGEHAAVVTILTDSFLEDLGSTNGTLVNGKEITKHFLRDHDYIDIGRHKLVYLVDESEVLPKETIRAATPRAAVGDLGEMVELAKPIVRAKRTTAARARKETAAGTVATRTEVTQRIVAFEEPPSSPPEEQPNAPADEPGAIGSLRILSGPSSGRSIKLVQAETTMGRAGIQVAAIVRAGEVFQLKPVEGAPPMLNGTTVSVPAATLASNDVIEVAGTRVEFVGVQAAETPAVAAPAIATAVATVTEGG